MGVPCPAPRARALEAVLSGSPIVGLALPLNTDGVVAATRDLVDVYEFPPEGLARRLEGRWRLVPAAVSRLKAELGGAPVLLHGVELSIGSATWTERELLALYTELMAELDVWWCSEHLGFLGGRGRYSGVPLPLPLTQEAGELVRSRVEYVVKRLGRPFLLENGAVYLRALPADPGWTEGRLMGEATDVDGGGVLLDLFNLSCNARNFGVEPGELLEDYPLDRVVELHVAGGERVGDWLLDAHCGPVEEQVWELVAETLPRLPRLRALVFEVIEERWLGFGIEGVRRSLLRAREVLGATG